MDSAQLLDHLGASGNAGSRLQAHLHAAVAFGSESQVMFAFADLTQVSGTFNRQSQFIIRVVTVMSPSVYSSGYLDRAPPINIRHIVASW